MNPRQPIARERQDEVLLDALSHHRHVVLTHQAPAGWQLLKAKFVAGSPSTGSILVKLAPTPVDEMPEIPEPRSTFGAAFRVGHKKCLFNTTLQEIMRGADGVSLVLTWPESLEQVQRRVFERAQPPKGMVVAVRFWRHQPSGGGERSVRHGQLEDLSGGGMRIKSTDPDNLEVGATYRCAFAARPGRPPLVVDAILRHGEAGSGGRASLGFQFAGLDATAEGREVLARIADLVNRFKRSRSRPRR